MSFTTFSFTAFAESDLFSGHLGRGVQFTQPASASLTIEVADNDRSLSGDFFDYSLDRYGQGASIDKDGEEAGNGQRIYAEKAVHLYGDDGKTYVLIEVEQEGSHANYYTYADAVPPAGVTLTVGGAVNVRGINYDRLGAGDVAQNIVDIAAGSDDFNILVKALDAAGLVSTVQGLDDVTVFAPTDAAFTQLAVDLGFDGDTSDEDAVFGAIVQALTDLGGGDPIPLLTDVLLYHVSGGAKSAAEIDALDAVPTLLTGATFGSEGTELVDNEPDVDNPNIVIPDIAASNGTIQVIDRVLLPVDIPGNELPNIVDIAAGSDDFNLLVKALSAAGLVETVRGLEDITVFAPTDAAFTQLAVDLGFDGDTSDEDAVFGAIVQALTDLGGGDPIPLLTDVLLYHVSGGAKSAAEIDALDAVPTLLTGATFGSEGTELVDNEPDVDNPNIVIPDLPAGNGTIQAIDRVLLPIDIPGNEPPAPELPTLAGLVASSGGVFDDDATDFDLLFNAVDAAGLTGALDDAGANLTVFAPNDGAFVSLANTLGFEGSDEGAAFGYIVDALTLLSAGGDPIPLLTDILLYHVAPDALGSTDVLAADSIPTLLGVDLGVDGASLVDAEPDVANPNLIATDIPTANGIAHVLDGVLLPVDLPLGGNVDFEIGTDANEVFRTGRGDDLASGKGGHDVLRLGSGDDVGLGGDGNDKLFGGSGKDMLDGGAGKDKLVGGRSDDMLTGGADEDVFVFGFLSGHDTITDFTAGEDTILFKYAGVYSFDHLMHLAHETETGVEFSLWRSSLTLEDVELADLSRDDFAFV